MKSVCVFLGSSPGNDPIYAETTRALGTTIAAKGLTLVYGGASVGCMGLLAQAALQAGGTVIGVMPKALADKEVAHNHLTELHIVGSMHERKAKMAELSDGFIALPGGLGTLEELFEVLTWAQLGFHSKPVALLDANGYYRSLNDFLDTAVSQGFVKQVHRELLLTAQTPEAVLTALDTYQPTAAPKWIERKDEL